MIITIKHEIYFMNSPVQDEKLDHVLAGINTLQEEAAMASAAMERLVDDVRGVRSAVEANKVFVAGLIEEIRANAADEKAMNALADDLEELQTEIPQAVVENTPAAPGGTAGGTGESASGTPETPAGESTDTTAGANEAKSE